MKKENANGNSGNSKKEIIVLTISAKNRDFPSVRTVISCMDQKNKDMRRRILRLCDGYLYGTDAHILAAAAVCTFPQIDTYFEVVKNNQREIILVENKEYTANILARLENILARLEPRTAKIYRHKIHIGRRSLTFDRDRRGEHTVIIRAIDCYGMAPVVGHEISQLGVLIDPKYVERIVTLCPEAVIYVGDETAPVFFTAPDGEAAGLVMPIKL